MKAEQRVLLVHPGASWSTADVYAGLRFGLVQAGVQVIDLNLDVRLARSNHWLTWNWKRSGKKGQKPTFADSQYLASTAALERALRFNVDWVIVVSAMFFHPDVLIMLRRAGRRVAVLMTESPYDDEPQKVIAGLVDMVWTNERSSVDTLREAQPNTFYLPHAYHPERHRPDLDVPDEIPRHDVVFVGTGFKERIKMLSGLPWDDGSVDLGLYGTWKGIGSRSWLRKAIRADVVDNTFAARLYRAAKVGLNWHRTSKGFGIRAGAPQISGAESLNPRCYELAACQSFFVTDRRAELAEVFGDLVPTFSSAAELDELVRRWLPDEEGRARRAREIREAVRPHSWSRRTLQVLEMLA